MTSATLKAFGELHQRVIGYLETNQSAEIVDWKIVAERDIKQFRASLGARAQQYGPLLELLSDEVNTDLYRRSVA